VLFLERPLLQGTSEGDGVPILACVMHKSGNLREPPEALLCIHSCKLGMAIEIFWTELRPDSLIDSKGTTL
jgi:hypothetical protein